MAEVVKYLQTPINYIFSKLNHELLLKTSIKDKFYVLKINSDGVSEIVNTLQYSDEILNFHYIDEETLLIIGKMNKKVEMFKNFVKVKEYTHAKKMTNSILIKENQSSFLILSDKFGEITIKKIDVATFEEPSKILTGHSDLIAFLRLSNNKKYLISADTFGKVKITNFPNVFKMETVLFYKDDDILFCDLLSDDYLVIININLEVFVWEMTNYSVIINYKLQSNEEKIRNIYCVANKILVEYETSVKLIDILMDKVLELNTIVDIKRDSEYFSFISLIDNSLEIIRLDSNSKVLNRKTIIINN